MYSSPTYVIPSSGCSKNHWVRTRIQFTSIPEVGHRRSAESLPKLWCFGRRTSPGPASTSPNDKCPTSSLSPPPAWSGSWNCLICGEHQPWLFQGEIFQKLLDIVGSVQLILLLFTSKFIRMNGTWLLRCELRPHFGDTSFDPDRAGYLLLVVAECCPRLMLIGEWLVTQPALLSTIPVTMNHIHYPSNDHDSTSLVNIDTNCNHHYQPKHNHYNDH